MQLTHDLGTLVIKLLSATNFHYCVKSWKTDKVPPATFKKKITIRCYLQFYNDKTQFDGKEISWKHFKSLYRGNGNHPISIAHKINMCSW